MTTLTFAFAIMQKAPFNTASYWEETFPAKEPSLCKKVADVAAKAFMILGAVLLTALIGTVITGAFAWTKVSLFQSGYICLMAGKLLSTITNNSQENQKKISDEKLFLCTRPFVVLQHKHFEKQDEIITCFLENSTLEEIITQTKDIFMNGHGKITPENMQRIKKKIKELASTGENLTWVTLLPLSKLNTALSPQDIKEIFTKLFENNSIAELSKRIPYECSNTTLAAICPNFKKLVEDRLKAHYSNDEAVAAGSYGLSNELDNMIIEID